MSKSKETVIAVKTTKGTAFLAGIEKALKQLKTIAETSYKTGGIVTAFGEDYNIKDENDPEALRFIMGTLLAKQAALNMGDEALGLTVNPNKIGNANKEDIIHDIQLKINILSTESKRKEYEALLEESKEFITQEDRAEMFARKLAASGIEL